MANPNAVSSIAVDLYPFCLHRDHRDQLLDTNISVFEILLQVATRQFCPKEATSLGKRKKLFW